MAGLSDAQGVNANGKLSTKEESDELEAFADYGRTFAKNHGRGDEVASKYSAISDEHGTLVALSAEGLAYFLMWGSIGGNTINGFLQGTLKGKTKSGSNAIFEILFVLFYGPLFVVINLTSRILSLFPSGVPSAISIIVSVILPTVASIWIIPYALIAMLSLPFIKGEEFLPIGGGYFSLA